MEVSQLLDQNPGTASDDSPPMPLIAHALHLAQFWGVTLVLKGAPTLIALEDGRLFANPTGNAGMATAGSGDVLTGTIAGLIAQGLDAQEAAVAGVFLHGMAGDVAKERIGEWGMKAGDIGRFLPEAIREPARQGHATT